jgi:phosphatidylserine/phosphatidylglycerophosphate/cardiolipin synthase-like enzyme
LNLNEADTGAIASGSGRSSRGPAARAAAAAGARDQSPKAKTVGPRRFLSFPLFGETATGKANYASAGYPAEVRVASEASGAHELLPVQYYSGADMLPVVKRHLIEYESLDAMQYVADHTELLNMITSQATLGRPTRIIFDRSNFVLSSCRRQCARVQELHRAGVIMKVLRPNSSSGFASMHTKCVIVNGKVVLTGSTNLTHGGFEHNIEHLLEITEPRVVDKIRLDFEHHWEKAEAVSDALLQVMEQKWQAKYGKAESAPPRRSPSPPWHGSDDLRETAPGSRSRNVSKRNIALLDAQS